MGNQINCAEGGQSIDSEIIIAPDHLKAQIRADFDDL